MIYLQYVGRYTANLCKILEVSLKKAHFGVDDHVGSSHQVAKQDRRLNRLQATVKSSGGVAPVLHLVRFGLAWFGLVLHGMVWFGLPWSGLVFGLVWLGMVRCGCCAEYFCV